MSRRGLRTSTTKEGIALQTHDDDENEVRRALATPVAEATPYQIELQGRHHANTNAYGTVASFPSDTSSLQAIVPSSIVWCEPGGPTHTENAHLLELVALSEDETLVCFRKVSATSVVRYGTLVSDLITTLSLDELCMSYPREVIRTASRVIHETLTVTGTHRALLRLYDTPPHTA